MYINVELYIGYYAIKYAFTYIYKGPNYTTITLEAQAAKARLQYLIDKIKEYIHVLYITAYKALQRIYKYYIYSRSIFIQQLIIYIEGQQFIIIQPNQALEKRFTQNTIYRTILIQFFTENIRQHIEIFYYKFPTYYTQNKRRKQQLSYYKGFSISYIIQILISAGEVYYLQLLLVNITSQYSFKDIRIFKG